CRRRSRFRAPREGTAMHRSLRLLRSLPLLACLLVALLPGCSVAPEPVGGFPQSVAKPQPVDSTFQGCPPEGDGGDAQLNTLKNRIDDGNGGTYFDVNESDILALPIPEGVERVARDNWSSGDAASVAQYEGTPVRMIGWIYGSRHEGTESTNCHSTDYRDFHVWVVPDSGDDRTQAVVCEVAPRVRAQRPG